MPVRIVVRGLLCGTRGLFRFMTFDQRQTSVALRPVPNGEPGLLEPGRESCPFPLRTWSPARVFFGLFLLPGRACLASLCVLGVHRRTERFSASPRLRS